MFTVIKESSGKEVSIVTQQYEIGTYVIINNDPTLQFCSNLKENEYHKKIRIDAIKRGDVILNGNIVNYKGKFPINTFKNDK